MAAGKDVLWVGVDLGTSRSSISASNGRRHVIESFVGWPVDMVARKVVKKPVLFGHEALENRTMLELHRPLERGLIKEGSARDEEAVRELLNHLFALSEPVSVVVEKIPSVQSVRAEFVPQQVAAEHDSHELARVPSPLSGSEHDVA